MAPAGAGPGGRSAWPEADGSSSPSGGRRVAGAEEHLGREAPSVGESLDLSLAEVKQLWGSWTVP